MQTAGHVPVAYSVAMAVLGVVGCLYARKRAAMLRESERADAAEADPRETSDLHVWRTCSRLMFWLAAAEVWTLAVRALQVHLGEYPGHPRGFWCALGLVGWVPGTIVAVPFAIGQMKRPAPRGDAGD